MKIWIITIFLSVHFLFFLTSCQKSFNHNPYFSNGRTETIRWMASFTIAQTDLILMEEYFFYYPTVSTPKLLGNKICFVVIIFRVPQSLSALSSYPSNYLSTYLSIYLSIRNGQDMISSKGSCSLCLPCPASWYSLCWIPSNSQILMLS